jgi:predicted ATPase
MFSLAAGEIEILIVRANRATCRCGLLFQDGTPPTAKYLFKHALAQDAAYGTLLRETRRTVHFRTGGRAASAVK